MLEHGAKYLEMADVEGHLWWYRALHHLVADALARHPKGLEVRMMDAGCGTGGLIRFLKSRGYTNVSGFDVSPLAVGICRERGLPVHLGDLREVDRAIAPGTIDAIVSNDTLYFFDSAEQESIVRRGWEALTPGGLLILNLPALSGFRGRHDLAVGIRQRFSSADIRRLLPPTHFESIQARFWPFLLSPIIYLVRLTQRIRLSQAHDLPSQSDLRLPPAAFNRLFETATRFENTLPPYAPFGSSLFIVGRKPI